MSDDTDALDPISWEELALTREELREFNRQFAANGADTVRSAESLVDIQVSLTNAETAFGQLVSRVRELEAESKTHESLLSDCFDELLRLDRQIRDISDDHERDSRTSELIDRIKATGATDPYQGYEW